MALIPLKQSVTILRAQGLDDFGEPLNPIRIPMKCRFEEESKLVKRYSSATGANQTMSSEVVSNARIVFDLFADLLYTDTIEYTNELGVMTIYSPLKIEPIRNFGGKPIMTVVHV